MIFLSIKSDKKYGRDQIMLECISKVSKINNKSDKKWGRSQIMLEWIAYKAHNKNLINSGGVVKFC